MKIAPCRAFLIFNNQMVSYLSLLIQLNIHTNQKAGILEFISCKTVVSHIKICIPDQVNEHCQLNLILNQTCFINEY